MPELWVYLVKKPTVISLFAGCGGSSLGYRMAGYRELLAVEWNKNAAETFRLNFPKVPLYEGDIAKLSVEQCLKLAGLAPGKLDVLDGSPPCQGFSTAGKRKLSDNRNDLFKEYARLLQGLQPKAFVMENVSGMVKGYMKQTYLEITKTLRACGYVVAGQVLNAMYYNVPQSRKRVIIIGVREDLGIEPRHPKPQMKVKTVRDAIADLPDEQDVENEHVWIDESPGGKNTKTYAKAKRAKPGEKYAGQQTRIRWDEPFPTMLKSGTAAVAIPPYLRNSHCHPKATRTLSIREMARAMSLPDSFVFRGSQKDKNFVIANSVPPNMMRAIAECMKHTLQSGPEEQV